VSSAPVESIPYVPQFPFALTVPSERCHSTAPFGFKAYAFPGVVAAKTTSPWPATGAATGDATMPPSSAACQAILNPFTLAVYAAAGVNASICASCPKDVHDPSGEIAESLVDARATATRTATTKAGVAFARRKC
jgi:hypothetical protein